MLSKFTKLIQVAKPSKQLLYTSQWQFSQSKSKNLRNAARAEEMVDAQTRTDLNTNPDLVNPQAQAGGHLDTDWGQSAPFNRISSEGPGYKVGQNKHLGPDQAWGRVANIQPARGENQNQNQADMSRANQEQENKNEKWRQELAQQPKQKTGRWTLQEDQPNQQNQQNQQNQNWNQQNRQQNQQWNQQENQNLQENQQNRQNQNWNQQNRQQQDQQWNQQQNQNLQENQQSRQNQNWNQQNKQQQNQQWNQQNQQWNQQQNENLQENQQNEQNQNQQQGATLKEALQKDRKKVEESDIMANLKTWEEKQIWNEKNQKLGEREGGNANQQQNQGQQQQQQRQQQNEREQRNQQWRNRK